MRKFMPRQDKKSNFSVDFLADGAKRVGAALDLISFISHFPVATPPSDIGIPASYISPVVEDGKLIEMRKRKILQWIIKQERTFRQFS